MAWFSDSTESKDNTANVVNNVKIIDHRDHINSLIITIVLVLQFLLTFYVKHKKIIKRRYMNRAQTIKITLKK